MRNQNSSTILRTVAGMYLLYLAWSLFKGMQQGETTSTMMIVSIAGCIAFAAAGAVLLFTSFRTMMAPPDETPDEPEKPENTENSEE